MELRWMGSIVLVAVIGIAALFLFPLAHGSYSATHGPTTALRAKHFRNVLMFVISAAVLGLAQAMALLVLGSIALITTESAAFSPSLPSYAPLRR
jgi:hypothetical protein